MTREEAINVVKNNWPDSSYTRLREALETLIPELKESEDEKVRKEMIYFFEEEIPQCSIKEHSDKMKEFVAWLEKQCEQKPIEPALAKICSDGRFDKTWQPKEQAVKMIQWKGDNLKDVIDFTGKSQNFDKWFKNWDDFEQYVHSHNNILKLFDEDGSHYEVPVGAWIVKTPDGHNVASQSTFVKNTAEWSEEDEEGLSEALWCCKQAASIAKDENDMGNAWLAENWLKSLKPQPHWKPSDEQMSALRHCCDGWTDNADGRLDSLYEDLKKL